MADFDLSNLLSKQTQYQAAKFGGGGLLDMAINAYQAAFPRAPLANLLAGGRQAYNIGKYNKAVQAEALRQQLRQMTEDANNASIYNKRTGQKISGPFDVTLANSAAPDIRKDNATPSLNGLLKGEALTLADQADYDPALVRDYLSQQSGATNFANGQNAGLSAIGAGQGQSLIGQALRQISDSKAPATSPLRSGQLEAGVSMTGRGTGIDTDVSPYLLPTDVPAGIAGLMKSGLDDKQEQGRQTETNRKNLNDEAFREKKFYQLDLPLGRNLMSYRNRLPSGGGGGSGNPFTIPNAMQTNLKNQIGTIEDQLKGMGYVETGGKISDDLYKVSTDPKVIRAQQLLAERALLQSQVRGGGTAPFQNQSAPKLQQADKNVGAQYGVKY